MRRQGSSAPRAGGTRGAAAAMHRAMQSRGRVSGAPLKGARARHRLYWRTWISLPQEQSKARMSNYVHAKKPIPKCLKHNQSEILLLCTSKAFTPW